MDNVCCVMSRKHSFMPTPPHSQRQFCRVCWTRSRRSRDSASRQSDSSTAERSARAATRWVPGPRSADLHAACRRGVRLMWFYQRGRAARPRGYCPSSALGGASRRIGRRSLHPPARAKHRGLLLVLADMRSIAAILLALVGRSLATSGLLLSGGRARAVLTVSPVCGRQNEARALRRCLRIAVAEWSGCRPASQSSCAGGTVLTLGVA